MKTLLLPWGSAVLLGVAPGRPAEAAAPKRPSGDDEPRALHK